MSKIMMSLLLALVCAPMPLSLAFAGQTKTQTSAQFKLIHAKDLAEMMTSAKSPIYIFDANTAQVRQQYGVIPGARLLNSSTEYDVSKELPANKRAELVFYCANTMCTASHSAAERAMSAGFHHVYVMCDGIMGWKKTGHPTSPATSSDTEENAAVLTATTAE